MKNNKILISAIYLIALNGCGGSQSSSVQLGDSKPEIPVEPTNPTETQLIKWHPGHYGLSLTPYNTTKIDWIHNDWSAILKSDDRFVGVNAFYSWYNLEPKKQGEYDFSAIDNDIAWINKNFPGKKLIIEIWTRDFSKKTYLPTVPQNPNEQDTKIPDYIISGDYDNSQGVAGATYNSNGRIAAFWAPPVLARLQALDSALAARYDKNPTVEMIKYDEYSPPAPSKDAPQLEWSLNSMIESWKVFHMSMSKNWQNTNKILMANWPSDTTGNPDKTLIYFLQSIKLGIGGPDILPPKDKDSPGETWGAMLLTGRGDIYGNIDYRGTIPVAYEAENPSWSINVADIEAYTYNTLQATHVGWVYNPYNIGSSSWQMGFGKTPWQTNSQYNNSGYLGVLDILKNNNFRIHSDCPTIYQQKCNTNG